MAFDHLCFHPDHGPHQCHCGIEADHTTVDFLAFCEANGLTPLASEIG